jgi:UDP-3-O-[3-hydroxymyristoyl] N-acetylglucosamine deacetylase
MNCELHGRIDVEVAEGKRPQRTILNCVEFSGIALHSGRESSFIVEPAPVDYGIRFDTRLFTGNTPVTTFLYSNDYTTSAITPDLQVQCVEHLLSSLHGLGITNVHIRRLEGDEFPIFDGSAREIWRAFRDAGIAEQGAPSRVLRIRAPFSLSDEGGRRVIACTPGSGLTIRADIEFPPPIGNQSYTFVSTPQAYEAQLASARTFLKDSIDLIPLAVLRSGRLKGLASPCQVISYNSARMLCELRFEDEAVRHKIADFMGDIYTMGMTVEGGFHLIRPGHELTRRFVELVAEALDRDHFYALPAGDAPTPERRPIH